MHVKAFESQAQLEELLTTTVCSATQEVLYTMTYNEPVMLQSHSQAEPSTESSMSGDISAIMTISSADSDGLICISLPLDLAKTLTASLIGLDVEQLQKQDYCDGVGELLNMIAGRVKMALSHYGNQPYRLSLPSIVFGEDHSIARRSSRHSSIYVLFEVLGQEFGLQCCFNTSDA